MRAKKTTGFSLLELMIVLSISLILTGVGVVSLQPSIKAQRVNNAYNITLSALRRAREQAAGDGRTYVVSFLPAVTSGGNQNGGTVTVNQTTPTGTQMLSVTLPADVTFHIEPGIPTSPTHTPTTPDGFGTGASYFDFDQAPSGTGGGSTVYFYPDGTAEDANGNINNGVVYLGRPGYLDTCRAITVWGYTGRLRGWRLYQNGTVWSWSQQ
jgi:prepilin-type N-terminal cleavage/methylation domain-containing protein